MECKEARTELPAGLTLTEEVRWTLISRMKNGFYAPGQKLPSEIDLASELGVSVAPIRAAFAQLVSAGLINRRSGSGTYVSQEPLQHQLSTWVSFTQELRRLGIDFATKVERYEEVDEIPSRVLARFPYLADASAMQLERIVEFDDRVRIITRSWFRCDWMEKIPSLEYFAEGNSLYSWFRNQGKRVVFAETNLQVTFMDDELAEGFGSEWGTPVVLLDGAAYTRSGQIEYSETYYDHTSFTFTATYATRTGAY